MLVFSTFANASCIELKEVTINGTIEVPKQAQQCINGKFLKELLTQRNEAYMQDGYVTTKAYLKPQNINDGSIELSLVKGMVEKIVDSENNVSNGKILTAFLGQENRQLNLRDIETSLEMLNRVPSIDAAFEIKPGSSVGQSIIVVKTKESNPYHLTLGLSGQETINDAEPYVTSSFSIDNLLGINDIFSFRLNGSSVQEEYQSTKGKEFNYAFPLGSYLLDFTVSDFEYRQGVNGINDVYLSTGKTKAKRVKLSKVLNRDQKNKINMAVSIYHKDTQNHFADQLVEVSSYKTTLAQVDLSHTHLKPWGQVVSTYSYYQGMNWFGARDDGYYENETDYAAQSKLQFKKHTLASNLFYRFSDPSYQLSSNFHLQYSKDKLYNNDKLTVGTDYTVRGYKYGFYADNAWYIKNDLTKSIKLDSQALFSPFIGLDAGYVRCEESNLNSCGELYGMALGFKIAAKSLNMDFTFSRPINASTYDEQDSLIFKQNISWQF